ncbi:unnamed protein product [Caretta caretta]
MGNEGMWQGNSRYGQIIQKHQRLWALIVIKSNLKPWRNSLLTDSKHGMKSFLLIDQMMGVNDSHSTDVSGLWIRPRVDPKEQNSDSELAVKHLKIQSLGLPQGSQL